MHATQGKSIWTCWPRRFIIFTTYTSQYAVLRWARECFSLSKACGTTPQRNNQDFARLIECKSVLKLLPTYSHVRHAYIMCSTPVLYRVSDIYKHHFGRHKNQKSTPAHWYQCNESSLRFIGSLAAGRSPQLDIAPLVWQLSNFLEPVFDHSLMPLMCENLLQCTVQRRSCLVVFCFIRHWSVE